MRSRTPRRRRFAVIAVASSLATLGLSATPLLQSSADATPTSFDVPFTVPFSANVNVKAFCDNTGNTVTVNGNSLLSGDLTENVIFKNNMKGTQSLTVQGVVGLDITGADGGNITIPKQPSKTLDGTNFGVGGNPYFSIYFMQVDKNGIETPFDSSTGVPGPDNAALLGRCVQGLMTGSQGANAALNALSRISLAGVLCTSKGSTINVGADTSHGGANVHILMDNNINKVVHEAQAVGHATFTLLPGQGPIHKGWGVGGAGGNPLVFTQSIINGTTGDQLLQGRCKDLAP